MNRLWGALLVTAIGVVALRGHLGAEEKRTVDLTAPTHVASLLTLARLSRAEVTRRLAPATIADDVAYEKLARVSRVGNSEVWPGWFFFRGDQLLMVYVGDDKFLAHLTAQGIREELGGDGDPLRSRAGKTARQHVYASRGFAYAEDHGTVVYVEVFPPTTRDDYLARIYQPVGPFLR